MVGGNHRHGWQRLRLSSDSLRYLAKWLSMTFSSVKWGQNTSFKVLIGRSKATCVLIMRPAATMERLPAPGSEHSPFPRPDVKAHSAQQGACSGSPFSDAGGTAEGLAQVMQVSGPTATRSWLQRLCPQAAVIGGNRVKRGCPAVLTQVPGRGEWVT